MSTIQILTEAEVESLINYLSTPPTNPRSLRHHHRNALLVALMLDAGLRVGEVVQLTTLDVYPTGSPVESIHLDADITKTHSDRDVPTTRRIRNYLTNYFTLNHLSDYNPNTTWLFQSTPGRGHLTTRQARRIINQISKAALGHKISPHTLRHTFATRLLRYSSTRIVQQLLGHKCLTSTQIYTHPNNQDLKQAIDQL